MKSNAIFAPLRHTVQIFDIDGLIDPHARVISSTRGKVRVGNIAYFCTTRQSPAERG